MKGIKGQLSSLSITDLMQWIDMNKKSGVLFVTTDEQNKCFIFEEGRLLLSSAREDGDRFGDFVQKEGYMNLEGLRQAVKDGQDEGRSFIGIMIDKNVMPEQFVKVTVEYLAEKNIIDILGWEEGSFYTGGSHIVRPGGEIHSRAAFLREDLLIAEIDLGEVDRLRWQLPLLREMRDDIKGPR